MFTIILFSLLLSLVFCVPINPKNYLPKYWNLAPRTRALASAALQAPYLPSLQRKITPDDYFRFIPTYIGSVVPGKQLAFSTSCFAKNLAYLTTTNASVTLNLATTQKTSPFCDDLYLFGYVSSFDITFFEVPWWTHTVNFYGPWTEAELYDINTNGIRVFKFPDGLAATAEEIFETAMLFFGALIGTHVPEWTAEDNLKFLKDHMNVDMKERAIQVVNISKSEVSSGDFLGIIRLDGLDPMLSWGMGARTGHTTIALWIDGELYVCESTAKTNYWDTNGIQKTPWDEWLRRAQAADFNVIHFKLKPELAKKFDAKKAAAFFKTVEGLPYGFHNQFVGWIDTAEDNYPPPLSSHLAQLLAPAAQWLLQTELQLGETFDFLRQGLNFRLGTQNLSLDEAYMAASKKGLSFTDLVTITEEDSWIYTNGNGTRKGSASVCCVFVMRMWKAGGIFGDLTDSIQASEFTDWDAYSLKLFADDQNRSKECVQADPDLPYCQLLGKYRLAIDDWNKYEPFAHMREKCPTIPPDYKKPANC